MHLSALLLLLSGDVESNPGPPGGSRRGRPEPKPDKHQLLQEKVDGQETKIQELETLVLSQKEVIEELRTAQVELRENLESAKVESERRLKEAVEAEKVRAEEETQRRQVAERERIKLEMEAEKVRAKEEVAETLREAMEREQLAHEKTTRDLEAQIAQLRDRLVGVDDLGSMSEGTVIRVREIEQEIDDILEKLWELDKSWRNNLVFYGLKQDSGQEEHPSVTESKIREVIHKKMQISRDIPILRVKRSFNGPDVRGSRPITVYFQRWQDKDEILRKTKLLKGSNIFIGEDFSKKVKDQRAELQKFMKWYRSRHPSAKFSLQYDRLFVDKRIFVFNEMSGRVEEQQGPGGGGGSGGLSTSPSNYYAATSESDIYSDLDQQQQLIRKKSSGRRRLQKSFSNESALNQMPDGTPTYVNSGLPDSPRKSPVKSAKKLNSVNNGPNDTNGTKTSEENGVVAPRKEEEHEESKSRDDQQDEPRKENGAVNRGKGAEAEDDDDLVDYTDASMSPIRRVNASIPETIPE